MRTLTVTSGVCDAVSLCKLQCSTLRDFVGAELHSYNKFYDLHAFQSACKVIEVDLQSRYLQVPTYPSILRGDFVRYSEN